MVDQAMVLFAPLQKIRNWPFPVTKLQQQQCRTKNYNIVGKRIDKEITKMQSGIAEKSQWKLKVQTNSTKNDFLTVSKGLRYYGLIIKIITYIEISYGQFCLFDDHKCS